jgi:hypothetical protein
MRWLLPALIWCLVACSKSDETSSRTDDRSGSVLLITKAEGQNDSTWMEDSGHLRVEAGCVLFKGQLVAFPFGTRLVENSSALQMDDDAKPVNLDGEAEVQVLGSKVPVGDQGDWSHVMDAGNLGRWAECQRRADISEYADWWQVSDITLASD